MDKPISEHLGGGAYITYDGYGYIFTANHHDPNKADGQVYLEPIAYHNLLRFFERITIMKKPELQPTPQSEECNCGACVACVLRHKNG